jgi:NADH-quinone oxidoreductase subunit F
VLAHAAHGEATVGEVDLVQEICRQIAGNSLCALGDAAAMGVGPIVKQYRDEILAEMAAAAGHGAHAGGGRHGDVARNSRLPVLQGA